MTGNYSPKNFKVFYSDGYKIGLAVVKNGLSNESLQNATEQIFQNMDRLIDSLLGFAQKQKTKVHCKKGCFWCCYQPVYLLKHEILYLQDFIRNNFTDIEIEEILKRAKEKNQKIGSLNQNKIQTSKHPCPLLKDGACTVYPARPMACRIYLSLNLHSCETFYSNPENPSGFPQLMEFPLQAGRMMNEGFKAALKQVGWVSSEFRIEEGLLAQFNV